MVMEMWEKRRDLMKKKSEELEAWRADEVFKLPNDNEEYTKSGLPAGRPKKCLSEDICMESEHKILDDIIKRSGKRTRYFSCKKITDHSKSKWNVNKVKSSRCVH